MALPKTTEGILSEIQATGAAYAADKPGAREHLLNLSYALSSSLELPSEAQFRMGWAEPARAAHCRIAVDLGLFDHLKGCNGGNMHVKDLATRTGASEVLLRRITRHLAAMNVVREVGVDQYAATPLSDALTEPGYRDGVIYTYDVVGPGIRCQPEHFRKMKYADPSASPNAPFQTAHQTDLHFFAFLDKNPAFLEAFNGYMSAYRAGKPFWADPRFFPIADLTEGFEASVSDVLLVDVGGGLGHDILELRKKHPSLPGRAILQDRPEVISAVAAEAAFEPMAHDFFTPQPVKHARAYFLHSVLHNWGDDGCVRILEQLKLAMKPGYSKVLVNELVVPDENATWPITTMDQVDLTLSSATKERTESEWRGILNRAGFSVLNVYSYGIGSENLIEAGIHEE
ncbi:putative O-methyltransferase [Xylariomycetidae sp. FL0641]|nr:putative O-methyltransferase [Xylariomycetidae sp. FL0641]